MLCKNKKGIVMAIQSDIHPAQIEILRQLLFSKDASFSALCKETNLSSDHFNFHIKKLLDLALVTKNEKKLYSLTTEGKEYANQLDTQKRKIEKQPKSSVLLLIERKDPETGETQFLQQQRLKQPWYEYFVYVTGKIGWGESIYETATRELEEETGLSCVDFTLIAISHERDFTLDKSKILEDKIFYVLHCKDPSGKLIQPKEARNIWMSKSEFCNSGKNIDGAPRFFDYLDKFDGKPLFEENEYFIDEAKF